MLDNLQNYVIGITFTGSFLILLFKKYYRILALSFTLLGLVLISFLIPSVYQNQIFLYEKYFVDFFSIIFLADGLSIFMAVVSSFIGCMILIYTLDYIRSNENQYQYFFYFTLFIASMLGFVFSANLLLMYVFWEMIAIIFWRISGFYGDDEHLNASDKMLYTTFLGSVFMLVGFALIYNEYNTLNILSLRGKEISLMAAFFIIAGLLSKSAQIPFYAWLPENSRAIIPSLAILLAAEVGIYAFARLFLMTFSVPLMVFDTVIIISILTIIISGSLAFCENDIKKILIYSTIAQIGYIFLGLSTKSVIGFSAALLYIIVHGFGKAGLFLSVGIIERQTGITDLRKLGGLSKIMPLVSIGFILCALSIIGLPPFGGFFAKLLIIMSLVQQGRILAASLAVVGAVFTLLYLFRLYNAVFLGTIKRNETELKTELSPSNVTMHLEDKTTFEENKTMIIVVLIFGILSLLLGLILKLPLSFIEMIK